jgi:hypothetical protein
MAYMKEQLVVAFSKISVLEEMVAGQAAMLTNQQTWNSAMSTESRNTSSRVVEADAKAEAAHTAAKAAENAIRSVDSMAKKAADLAGKALQITADTQNQLRALEASMVAINKKQQDLAQHLSGPPLAQADQAVANSKLLDTSENSIFFAGVQQYRRRLNLHPQSDPIFVVSVLLKEMGIYAGMDSIVLADNAAKARQEARAVIIHMQSNFHKRAAMAIMRRELATQRLQGTAVRDCFPSGEMDTVRRYARYGMELKTTGKVAKFQVVNRKGKPVLQTGARNQNYTDYTGDIPMEVPAADRSPWTLVEGRRKRTYPEGTLTSPNSHPIPGDRQNIQPKHTDKTTWAEQADRELAEIQTTSTSMAGNPGNEVPKRQTVQKQPQPQQRQQRPGDSGETPSGSQQQSEKTSRAGSRSNSRPSTPPPIRNIFDTGLAGHSEKPKEQRQFKTKAAKHLQHSRNGY